MKSIILKTANGDEIKIFTYPIQIKDYTIYGSYSKPVIRDSCGYAVNVISTVPKVEDIFE